MRTGVSGPETIKNRHLAIKDQMNLTTRELLEKAVTFAKAGGDHTRQYFGSHINVEMKTDASPVTRADREAETLIRERIRSEFPDHNIVGEEFGEESGGGDVTWIIDPIDGTESFIHGIPLYTTLIGVMIGDNPIAGVIYAPATGECCAAGVGLGATLNDKPCRVRSCEGLDKATLLTTDYPDIEKAGLRRPFDKIMAKVRVSRTWGDAYGHMMVATGRADIMFDPFLNIWDAAPLLTIITEAGGSFTDMKGRAVINGGNGFSCNKILFPEIRNYLNL